ncbi:MAG: FAD-binding protein [Anaerolineales bacterium]|nr:FAD-binding protein [Anaerolineales bacterium]
MNKEKYDLLYNEFLQKIPKEKIYTDELNRLAYGTDASIYRLIPKIVIKVKNSEEVQFVVSKCNEMNVPVTFRAAGTSLSGQAISDSVLMVAERDWRGYKISDDKQFISLEPMVIGSFANAYLKPFDKKIGPDPASINAAAIGGIAANNASGMCCGTAQNSYNTVKSMKIILRDGTLLDTGNEESVNSFKLSHKELVENITKLHKEINSDEELSSLIRHKYKMKNTTGYSLNSLVDFSDPIDIIEHLMIGSEGTLGFISEITYRTVLEAPNKASTLILFKNMRDACKAVITLKKQEVDAVELMDRASLRSVEKKEGMPTYLKTLDENVTSLLVETSAVDKVVLKNQINQIANSLQEYELVLPVEFTDVPAEYSKLWNIRKGLFPSVGAMREVGTSCIIEDVAFPLDKLADAALELQSLFTKYHYDEAIIFGHSLEGNLHFVFNQDFSDEKEVLRYKEFMDEVIKMTAGKYKGSLKAEHGTGRNMAPFVKYEWGEKAYTIMKRIKNIFDPQNILNPGVILNNDKLAHLHNLKPLPQARDIIDKCIECGFCEPSCPSKDLTLTPRQRITTYREIAKLTRSGKDVHRKNELIASFKYYGEETCATDGLCAIACPVDIDLPKLLLRVRAGLWTPVGGQAGEGLPFSIKFGMGIYRRIALHPHLFAITQKWMGRITSPAKSDFLQIPAWTGWGHSKDFPRPAARSFREKWHPETANKKAKKITPTSHSQIHHPRQKNTQPLTSAFTKELLALSGEIIPVSSVELPGRLIAYLRQRGVTRIQAEAGVTKLFQSTGIAAQTEADPGIAIGITTAIAAVAETGSILVTGNNRATLNASLLPNTHIAILRAESIRQTLDEVLALPAITDARAAVLISGPSRTADIEMTLTIGVHGPGELIVFLVDG